MPLTFRKFFESKEILITEANLDDIYQRYYKDVINKPIFDKIASIFRNNSEIRWAVNAYKNSAQEWDSRFTGTVMDPYWKTRSNLFLNEDLPKVKEYFDKLNLLKQKNVKGAKELNIFAIKNIPDLAKAIDEISGSDDEQNVDELSMSIGKGGKKINFEKIFENEKYIVVRPKDKDSLGELARGTEWCVSYDKDECYIDQYAPVKNIDGHDNRLYLIRNKTNKKDQYLFHFLTDQMMDFYDRPLDTDNLINLSPELRDAMLSLYDHPEIKKEILNSSKGALNYLILKEIKEGTLYV